MALRYTNVLLIKTHSLERNSAPRLPKSCASPAWKEQGEIKSQIAEANRFGSGIQAMIPPLVPD